MAYSILKCLAVFIGALSLFSKAAHLDTSTPRRSICFSRLLDNGRRDIYADAFIACCRGYKLQF